MKKVSLIVSILVIISLAFSGCGQTTSMGLEFISNSDGTCALSGIGDCNDITVVVPEKNSDGETIVSVTDSAFRNIPFLTVVTLPDTVTSIGEYAFADNGNLIKAELPAKLKKLDSTVFSNCTSLSDVVLGVDFKYAMEEYDESGEVYKVTVSTRPIENASESAVFIDITDENRDDIFCRLFGKENITVH